MMIDFGLRAHWNMFTSDKKELIEVYNNIVERFNIINNMSTCYINMSPDNEIRIAVESEGAILLWYYPKDIEEVDRNSAKTCFQYKIDMYKDKGMIQPRYMIHYDDPKFYIEDPDDLEEHRYDSLIMVKNKKLRYTNTQRMNMQDNIDDVYNAFIDWYDKIKKDALKARIEAI